MKWVEATFRLTIGRPEQLNLPDDPTFVPDFVFDFDVSLLGLSSASSRDSSFLSPPSRKSSQSSRTSAAYGSLPGLVFPSGSDNGVVTSHEDFHLARHTTPFIPSHPASGTGQESGLLVDVDFEFDHEGNMVEKTSAPATGTPQRSAPIRGSGVGRDSANTSRVRQEHEQGLQPHNIDVSFGDAKKIRQ